VPRTRRFGSFFHTGAGDVASMPDSLVNNLDMSPTADLPFRAIVESASQGMAIGDSTGVIKYCNHAFERMLAIPPGAALGTSIFAHIHPSDRTAAGECLGKCLAGSTEGHDRLMLRADGASVTCSVSTVPILAPDGTRTWVAGIFTDLSERIHYERELRHAQKMDAVGQLAGGIAHDFNNLVTAIFGYVDIAKRTLAPDHPAVAALDGVKEAAEQAAGVTRGLLTFTRKASPEKSRINLREVVEQSAKLLRRAMSTSIHLITSHTASGSPSNTPAYIDADQSQIQQVILNLALNARDAMPDGGTLRLAVDTAVDPTHRARQVVRLVVSDTGAGIPDEVLPRVFEPFFTTKGDYGHNGLGLSIVDGIVRSHAGRITVNTTLGMGSTFKVTLPAVAAPDARPEQPNETPQNSRSGEVILLVEDREQIRQIIAAHLRHLGYSVLEAASGESALQALEGHGRGISLAICDFELPDRPGDELAAAIRARDARIPVLLVTGSSQFNPADIRAERISFLRKPFGMAQLADRVFRLLSEDPAAADSRSTQGSA
jgi:two-component system, cell cycle sensor histidine kinase and response regulator CckA